MTTATYSFHTLDSLVDMSKEDLDALFFEGETPAIDEFYGPMEGRVLAGIPPLQMPQLMRWINNPLLPWKGKNFEPVDEFSGKGINRLELGPIKQELFHFTTSIIPSLVGAGDVFSLNYDLPGNPWPIRQIRDDMKKVGDGLFLGTANARMGDRYQFVLYFALQA